MDVEVTPTDLRFRFQVNKQLPATISLHNPSSDRVAFKVKTTTPKKYVVRPSSGVVEAGGTSNVQVIMQAQKEFPPDFQNCKDKFKVETLALDAGEEITAETFKAANRVKDTKIRVILEGPPAPPSPVPEVNEAEEDSIKSDKETMNAGPVPTPLRYAEEPAALSSENRQLRAQLERTMAERDALQKQMGTSRTQARAQAKPGMPILTILVVAIIAFLVGHLIKPDLLQGLLAGLKS